jgi:hypothetical protein
MALPIGTSQPKLAVLGRNSTGSSTPGHADPRQRPLPRVTAPKRQKEHRCRLSLIHWEHKGPRPPTGSQSTLLQGTNPSLPSLPPITDSLFFCNLSPSQQGFSLGHANTANRRSIFDSRQEDANKKLDRVWQRWKSFCTKGGDADNPYLLDVCGSDLLI